MLVKKLVYNRYYCFCPEINSFILYCNNVSKYDMVNISVGLMEKMAAENYNCIFIDDNLEVVNDAVIFDKKTFEINKLPTIIEHIKTNNYINKIKNLKDETSNRNFKKKFE